MTLLCQCTIAGLPPTANHVYRSAGGRRYKTKEGRDWQSMASSLLCSMVKLSTPYEGAAAVRYVFCSRSKRRWDLDNRIKVIQDCLAPAGILADDSQIMEVSARRVYGNEDWTQVSVWAIGDEDLFGGVEQ
ncbi:MAG: RusA family crossover junction endodeoxyribonuclease [Pyramidobacter sp.]|nr:RusA family crossover junction endodeoxyribonuclease [Pyramidobacter sp.]